MAALGYVLLVALGAGAAGAVGRVGRVGRDRLGAGTLWLVVALPSLLQLAYPGLLALARRDPDRIAAGQVWRLVTSAVTQDGGLPGTAFNLVVLAVTAATSVRVLGPGGLWTTFWTGAVAGNLLVLALLPSVGAGNSIATFTVSAATVSVVAVRTRRPAALLRQAAVVLLGGLLLVAHDQHGLSVAVGTAVGLLLAGRPGSAGGLDRT